MVKIHLKDAYFLFPVCQKDQTFTRFYEIACLQFGLSSATPAPHYLCRPHNLLWLSTQNPHRGTVPSWGLECTSRQGLQSHIRSTQLEIRPLPFAGCLGMGLFAPHLST